MYQINLCSPIWDNTPVSGFNIRIVRVLLITVLFMLYIMYLIIHFILRKAVKNLKYEDSGQKLYEKQSFMENWEREYLLMLGDHFISVCFVICFSPYQFQILISFLYFVLRCLYEVLYQKFNLKISPIKTLLRIINLTLLICAIVGLSRTQTNKNTGICRDFDYRRQ